MKAEKIKVITIKDFKDYPEVIVYIDENIDIERFELDFKKESRFHKVRLHGDDLLRGR